MRKQPNLATLLPALALVLALPAAAATSAKPAAIKASGTLTIQGDCRILTDAKGHKFALVGALGALAGGDRILVTGTAAKPTSCLKGPAIQVAKAEKIKPEPAAAPPPGAAAKSEPAPPQPGDKQVAIDTEPGGARSSAAGEEPPVRVLHMTGTLTAEGTKCQAFRSLKGLLFTLSGDLKGFKTGDKVRIEGIAVDDSSCKQSTTVQINSIQPAS